MQVRLTGNEVVRICSKLSRLSKIASSAADVCLWHNGRCGSTVVGDLVSQDGRIAWLGEILEPLCYGGLPSTRLNKNLATLFTMLRSRLNCKKTQCGFEIKAWQLERLELPLSLLYVYSRSIGAGHHLVLERKNYLRHFVSIRVAMERGDVWHIPQGQSLPLCRVEIEPRELRSHIRLQAVYFRKLRTTLPKDSLFLTYEDDVMSDPRRAYQKILHWIGLETKEPKPVFGKTTLGSLRYLIINFDEVARTLQDTEDEWMLEDSESRIAF